jgi:hypothetical protein
MLRRQIWIKIGQMIKTLDVAQDVKIISEQDLV